MYFSVQLRLEKCVRRYITAVDNRLDVLIMTTLREQLSTRVFFYFLRGKLSPNSCLSLKVSITILPRPRCSVPGCHIEEMACLILDRDKVSNPYHIEAAMQTARHTTFHSSTDDGDLNVMRGKQVE